MYNKKINPNNDNSNGISLGKRIRIKRSQIKLRNKIKPNMISMYLVISFFITCRLLCMFSFL